MRPYREFEVSFDSPATGKKSRNVEIPVSLFKLIMLTMFLLAAFMYVLGVRYGLSVKLPPRVEVTSKELEKP